MQQQINILKYYQQEKLMSDMFEPTNPEIKLIVELAKEASVTDPID